MRPRRRAGPPRSFWAVIDRAGEVRLLRVGDSTAFLVGDEGRSWREVFPPPDDDAVATATAALPADEAGTRGGLRDARGRGCDPARHRWGRAIRGGTGRRRSRRCWPRPWRGGRTRWSWPNWPASLARAAMTTGPCWWSGAGPPWAPPRDGLEQPPPVVLVTRRLAPVSGRPPRPPPGPRSTPTSRLRNRRPGSGRPPGC